jgi:L-lactate dehydrogenase complex protein LldF
MKVKANNFIPAAQVGINDADLREAVSFGAGQGAHKRELAMFAYGKDHGEALRQQAAASKRHALQRLPDLLQQAEAALQANGCEVLWAVNAEEANRHVLDIARRHDVHLVTKSKSMVTEEIGLNDALQEEGLSVVETDLGEFIVQLSGDTPSHIVVPIVHKTKRSIRETLVTQAGMSPTDDTEEMARYARRYLRQKFLEADMGVSGGNFIIAETGTLCLVTNEGNARMVTSLPRVHVALVGIEKVIPSVEDYATLTQVLSRSATGQTITVYTHMIHGPRRPQDSDGPEHVYVIFVDNGRSRIYGTEYAEALACIRCGACLNACPVYRVTGGHAYGWVYPGPIGAVITPLLTGLENATPLPYASSLCGRCKEVCPVDIDLPRMLLDLRHDLVAQGLTEWTWDTGMSLWSRGTRSPRLFTLAGRAAALGASVLGRALPPPLSGWTRYRDFPRFAPRSFHQLWAERRRQEANDEQ